MGALSYKSCCFTYAHALSDLEQITNVASEATLSGIISGNLLQPIDWGAPGVNYGTPNGP